MEERTETPIEKNDIFIDSRGKFKIITSCNHDINYFHYLGVGHVASQCTNKQAMAIKDHGGVVTYRKVSDDEEMPHLGYASDEYVEYSVKGEVLVVK
jgi:hypothetical protein